MNGLNVMGNHHAGQGWPGDWFRPRSRDAEGIEFCQLDGVHLTTYPISTKVISMGITAGVSTRMARIARAVPHANAARRQFRPTKNTGLFARFLLRVLPLPSRPSPKARKPMAEWSLGTLTCQAHTKSEARAHFKKRLDLKRIPAGWVVTKNA